MSKRYEHERGVFAGIGEAAYADRMEHLRYRLRATTLDPKKARKLRATLSRAEFVWSTRKLAAARQLGAPTS